MSQHRYPVPRRLNDLQSTSSSGAVKEYTMSPEELRRFNAELPPLDPIDVKSFVRPFKFRKKSKSKE